MNDTALTEPSQARLRAFALGSAILHGLVLTGWQTSPWLAGHAESVLSVTMEPGRAQMASAEIRLTAQPAHRSERRAAGEQTVGAPEGNNRRASQPVLPATSTETQPADNASSRTGDSRQREDTTVSTQDVTRDDSQDTQTPAIPSALAAGEEAARSQAMAQIRARLNTDLARYFDYPYVARLRNWEGSVLLAFHIETDGRLENIRIARSSGFAVLDDSALNSLRQVERLAEAAAWLRGRELAMQIPVIYRLRCFGGQACREVRVAVGGPENR